MLFITSFLQKICPFCSCLIYFPVTPKGSLCARGDDRFDFVPSCVSTFSPSTPQSTWPKALSAALTPGRFSISYFSSSFRSWEFLFLSSELIPILLCRLMVSFSADDCLSLLTISCDIPRFSWTPFTPKLCLTGPRMAYFW